MINLTIDGIKLSVAEDTTILDAAEKIGIRIPTLCHHPDQAVKANCRVCVCEVEGEHLLQTACSTAVKEGMVIRTHTPRVIKTRKLILQLILGRHPQDCLNCIRNQNCELQALVEEYGIRDNLFPLKLKGLPEDRSTIAIVREPDKCIECRRCVEACSVIQTVNALCVEGRNHELSISPVMSKPLAETGCVLSLYSLEKGLSVASFCVTLYCIDVSFSFKVLSSGLKYFLLIFILLSNLFFYSVQIAWFLLLKPLFSILVLALIYKIL
jgi:NADH-quinone oxidoreductase subunit G